MNPNRILYELRYEVIQCQQKRIKEPTVNSAPTLYMIVNTIVMYVK